MKKRNEKIKEIEDLIENNGCSRRKFIDSIGKTIALSSIATLGLTSLLSCEKAHLDEEIETTDRIPSPPPKKKAICLEGDSCTVGYAFHLGGSGS